MANQVTPEEGEVDLGSLFKIIGRGFRNLFNAIGQLFISISHYFILCLLFVRNNALKLGLALLIGGGIGLFYDLTKPKVYSSSMLVEPNFKSTHQLYKNIDFYNELVKQKDTLLLAKTLGITTSEASSLEKFYIEPIKNNNEKYDVFNKFIQALDSTTVNNINIKEFNNNFTAFDYRYHEVTVKSTNNTVFDQLQAPLVNSIETNAYFKNRKKINDQNLLQNENVLRKSLSAVDTLRNIYNKVLITEANKMETGTSITLAQGVKKTEEIQLFDQDLKLNEELIINNMEKAETTEILNVVSNFSEVGIKERGIFKKYAVIYGIAACLGMMLFILFAQLNRYLKNYQKN